ncbi:hypothetical protein Mgra_00000251 [Meloidogyne graminicola]|uniref:Uncharacterized protein n=1 Tax=Meloidogyne graminicola TaxID=189291 RepID=A0A8T0A4F9_9BILA|nr:hypothetical protein Mgra_00000251 [Meloidogyne graminicola]
MTDIQKYNTQNYTSVFTGRRNSLKNNRKQTPLFTLSNPKHFLRKISSCYGALNSKRENLTKKKKKIILIFKKGKKYFPIFKNRKPPKSQFLQQIKVRKHKAPLKED